MTPLTRWEAFLGALRQELGGAPDLTRSAFNGSRWPDGKRWAVLRRIVAAAGSRAGLVGRFDGEVVRWFEGKASRVAVAITADWDRVGAFHAGLSQGEDDVKVVMTVMRWAEVRADYRDSLLQVVARHPDNRGRAVVATVVGEQKTTRTHVSFYAHAVAPDGTLLVCNRDIPPPRSECFFQKPW